MRGKIKVYMSHIEEATLLRSVLREVKTCLCSTFFLSLLLKQKLLSAHTQSA